MHPFERAMLRSYLTAFAGSAASDWTMCWRTSALSAFVLSHAADLGLRHALSRDAEGGALSVTVTSHFRTPLRLPRPSGVERRLRWLGDLLQLPQMERRMLGLLVRVRVSTPFASLVEALDTPYGQAHGTQASGMICSLRVGHLLGLHRHDRSRLAGMADTLVRLGLVEAQAGSYSASSLALRLAGARTIDEAAAWGILCGKPRRTDLAWTDFAHLGEEAEVASRLVAAAIHARARGVNILLHGAPGVGKTQFACALAARLGLHAMFVGEADEDGEEPSRGSRLAALAVSQKLGVNARGLLLVVDEADDLFIGVDDALGANRKGAKVFVNTLVEASPVPTVWISNHADRLGAAVLRRMAFALAFPEQDRAGRERMVRTVAVRHEVELGEEEVRTLAALKAPAAIIDHGIRAARLCREGGTLALQVSSSIIGAMTGERPDIRPAQPGFVAALSHADHDLPALVARIVASGRMDISLCLHGVPGTGKTAFARHLAGRMGLDVMEKRASDLFGMYVGETEAAIAKSFREAEREKAFLIFDEADSLLWDRAGARQSHEVTQVNEMLSAMERHPYPFACTTNRVDSLDPAAARRFVLKIGFLPLRLDQARALFRLTFGEEAPPRLDRLHPLTPGDFAVVARKCAVVGEDSPHGIVEALALEVAAKPEGRVRPIGFRPVA